MTPTSNPTRKPSTITVRGFKVSNRTNRRFSVIAVREQAIYEVRESSEPYAPRVCFQPGFRNWTADWDEAEAARPAEGRISCYVAFADIVKRSDSIDTARKAASRHERGPGCIVVVVDTVTGEEV